MALPEHFRINTDTAEPFSGEALATLPRQQQILERALGTTKYMARTVRVLARESGLTPTEVREYCEASSHVARSPLEDYDGHHYYGHVVRLREKYHVSTSGHLYTGDGTTPTRAAYDVFLSYTQKDVHIANEIREELAGSGMTCFMAEKDIRASGDWTEEIRGALHSSEIILLLLTQRSLGKPWILLEAGAAWALGKRIVPLLNQVDASEIIDPLTRHQARVVEITEQRVSLAVELKDVLQRRQLTTRGAQADTRRP